MSSRLRAPFAFALLVIASACGSDSSVAPIAAQPTDLNQVFSELALSNVRDATSWTALGSYSPTVPVVIPSSCTYSAPAQSFTCPSQTVSGVTITQSFTLLSESGTSQSAFDASKTAAVRMTATMTGKYKTSEADVALDGQQTLTVSGLLTGKHVVDGTSSTHLVGTLSTGIAVPINSTIKTTIASLVLPPSSAAKPYPLSGTVTVETNAAASGLPQQAVSMQLTFNGTSKIAVVLAFGGVTDHCTLDLASTAPNCA